MASTRKPAKKRDLAQATNTNDSPIKKTLLKTAPADLDTESRRKLAIAELTEQVPVVEWSKFNKLLPSLPTGVDVDSVLLRLKNSRTITSSNKWTGFYMNPGRNKRHEDDVFSSFQVIADAIVDAVSGRSPSIRFRCNPKAVPVSWSRNNTSKPDSYGIHHAKADAEPVEWINVFVPGEFKKSDNDASVNDNRKKLIWSLHHIMCEDARRRFVYGFTIENTTMRLWYANRSEIVVSYPFDFATEHTRVVEVILRLAFAEFKYLGVDPTMSLLPGLEPGTVQYDIKVDSTTYRTQRLISNVGAESLRGRGTRVWEVKELIGENMVGTESFVLKDSWVDKDRAREEDILREIRNSTQEKNKQPFSGNRYLLNIIKGWDVMVDGEPDDTHTCLRSSLDSTLEQMPTLPVKADPLAHMRVKTQLLPLGGPKPPKPQPNKDLQYPEKVHHRLIFKEVAKTIEELDTLSDMFSCLHDAVTGLRELHQCGWVHRDVSSGNILSYERCGKLADLEYAKSRSDSKKHGIRTGTPLFMPHEVEVQRYLYLPPRILVELDEDEDDDGDKAEDERKKVEEKTTMNDEHARDGDRDGRSDCKGNIESSVAVDELGSKAVDEGNKSEEKRPTPFRHNPLHDLESILWLALYLVLCSDLIPTSPAEELKPEERLQYMENHTDVAALLFLDSKYRATVINTDEGLLEGLDTLLPGIHNTMKILDDIRATLHAMYLLKERNRFDIKFGIGPALYRKMLDGFKTIAEDTKGIKIGHGGKAQQINVLRERIASDDRKRAAEQGEISEDLDGEDSQARPFKSQKQSHGAIAAASRPAQVSASIAALLQSEPPVGQSIAATRPKRNRKPVERYQSGGMM